MFNVTNINFVVIYINYMTVYGNLYIPGRVQVAYYCEFSNSQRPNALLNCT